MPICLLAGLLDQCVFIFWSTLPAWFVLANALWAGSVRKVLHFQADIIENPYVCVPLSSPTSSDAAILEVTYSRWWSFKCTRCGCKYMRLEQRALDCVDEKHIFHCVRSLRFQSLLLRYNPSFLYHKLQGDTLYLRTPLSHTTFSVGRVVSRVVFLLSYSPLSGGEFSSKVNRGPPQIAFIQHFAKFQFQI